MKCFVSGVAFEWCGRILGVVVLTNNSCEIILDIETLCLPASRTQIYLVSTNPQNYRDIGPPLFPAQCIPPSRQRSLCAMFEHKSAYSSGDATTSPNLAYMHHDVVFSKVLTFPLCVPLCSVGYPNASFFARSKSLNTMCPDSLKRTSIISYRESVRL